MIANNTKHKYFVARLLLWNKKMNDRSMPWKGEKDAYKIWLSEIILQQTTVAQGLPYYNRFISEFPTIEKLASTSETKIFKLWQGLGYYNRCKNLIATAQFINTQCQGIFPTNYVDILKLKGIGPYTAAAIASFAYNLPHAVVDGNVFRVLSRFFNISTPIDTTEGKKTFNHLAHNLLPANKAGVYNQALMDFGAVICKPQLPLCPSCVLKSQCSAYLKNLVNILPVKEKVIVQKTRWFYYLVIVQNNKVYVHKRSAKDIWENLYQFFLIETEDETDFKKIQNLPAYKNLWGKAKFSLQNVSKLFSQKLTHQTIHARFIQINIAQPIKIVGYKSVAAAKLNTLPFPKLITTYLQDKNVSLNLLA